MKSFILDYTDHFFEKYEFCGLSCSFKPEKLCWVLEKYLNQKLKIYPNKDIPILRKQNTKKSLFSLFDAFHTEEEKTKWYYHAIIETQFPYTNKQSYIYQNKLHTSVLIPEYKHYDYILALSLIGVANKHNIENLLKIPFLDHINQIDILKVKSKNNLLL